MYVISFISFQFKGFLKESDVYCLFFSISLHLNPMFLACSSCTNSESHTVTLQDMGSVSFVYIVIALVPALMITMLDFFDHPVASQLTQQKEFNLKNPPAYHYDILMLGLMVFFFKQLYQE